MPIFQSISRFFQTLQIPFTVSQARRQQQRFIRKNIEPLPGDAQKNAGDYLEENEIKKITGCYGLIATAVLGEAFCILRDEPMTKKERLACSCLGAMRGLADSFFTNQEFTEQDIMDFVEKPEQFTGNTAAEKLFIHFYTTALATVPQPAQLQQLFYKVAEAELFSKQQHGTGLSYEVIKDITIRRGAAWMLLYRAAFDHPVKKGEEKLLYSLGGLVQFSEDTTAVYNDDKNGRSTLITTATKTEDIRLLFLALLQICKEAAYRSGYYKNNVREFLGFVNYSIFSAAYVYLARLNKLEKRSNRIFDLKSYSTTDLKFDKGGFGSKWNVFTVYWKLYNPQ